MKPAFAWGMIALVIVGAFIGFQSLFTVHRTEQALVLRFGEPIRVITRAGLNTSGLSLIRSSTLTSGFSIWRRRYRR